MPFLYGNHVLKAHIGRMSDDIPEHAGVIIYSMNDIPLGFGASAKSTAEQEIYLQLVSLHLDKVI